MNEFKPDKNKTTYDTTITSHFAKHIDHSAHTSQHSNKLGLDIMLKLINPQKADTVLDVACGDGIVAFEFASLVKQVTGIDLTPPMIQRAEIIQEEKDLDNIEWKIGDVSILPFHDSEFSIVVTRYSIHHLINPQKVLKEMSCVCKSGGRIMVVDITPEKDKRVL